MENGKVSHYIFSWGIFPLTDIPRCRAAAIAGGAASLDNVHPRCSRTAPCPRVGRRSISEPGILKGVH